MNLNDRVTVRKDYLTFEELPSTIKKEQVTNRQNRDYTS